MSDFRVPRRLRGKRQVGGSHPTQSNTKIRKQVGKGLLKKYPAGSSRAKSVVEEDEDEMAEAHDFEPGDINSKKMSAKADRYKKYSEFTEPLEIMAQVKLRGRPTAEYPKGEPIRGKKGGARVTIPCTVHLDRLPAKIKDAIEYRRSLKDQGDAVLEIGPAPDKEEAGGKQGPPPTAAASPSAAAPLPAK
jgi:hypothetical protein